jgi:NitT/TauT family transport system substrate-binding protein
VRIVALLFVIVAVTVMTGCGPADGVDPGSKTEADGLADGTASDSPLSPLIVGLMPAVDTAPFFVARDAAYFSDEGLEVTFELFTNAQDRQSALQTGMIDGAMTDLVAVAVNVAGGFDIRATMLTDGVFPVMAQPGAAEMRRVRIGVMEVSVANYLVDRWLSDDYVLEKVFINSIPARLEAVVAGQLDMGLFPEPVASVGEMRGLEKILFEPVDGFSPDVIVFTGDAREHRSREIAAFHAAYNRAVADIAADPSVAMDAIISNIPNVSEELREFIVLPEYHPARLPDDEAVTRIIEWTRSVVDGDLVITAAELLDRSYIAD